MISIQDVKQIEKLHSLLNIYQAKLTYYIDVDDKKAGEYYLKIMDIKERLERILDSTQQVRKVG
jgi:hypothetical protein